jgi:hypothetical protein
MIMASRVSAYRLSEEEGERAPGRKLRCWQEEAVVWSVKVLLNFNLISRPLIPKLGCTTLLYTYIHIMCYYKGQWLVDRLS